MIDGSGSGSKLVERNIITDLNLPWCIALYCQNVLPVTFAFLESDNLAGNPLR